MLKLKFPKLLAKFPATLKVIGNWHEELSSAHYFANSLITRTFERRKKTTQNIPRHPTPFFPGTGPSFAYYNWQKTKGGEEDAA